MKHYPMQILALDDDARQAVELASLSKFEAIGSCDIDKLPFYLIAEHRHVLLLSQLSEAALYTIIAALKQAEDPIVILPQSTQTKEELKPLLLNGIRVILSPSDTLTSIAFSQTLLHLESLFYRQDHEGEILLEHDDIYATLPKGSIIELHQKSGTDLGLTTMQLFNLPHKGDDIVGAILHFTLHPNRPLMEVAGAMEIAEARIPESAMLMFGIQPHQSDPQHATIVAWISRYYDFIQDLQNAIDESATYLGRAAVIVDAVAEGVLNETDAHHLAEYNGIASSDLRSLYTLTYTQPSQIVSLIETLGRSDLAITQRVEAAAEAVVNQSVDDAITEALIHVHQIPIDEVLEQITHKRKARAEVTG